MNFNPAILRSNLMHAKIMEWTNDDALELIEQYRTHTELWNRADPKYKDKLCRFRAWSEIAERFGCSKAEVERKMNVLLTQYRREKHKMLVKLYQGIQPNPSKWYAFKRFDFMEAGGGTGGGGGGGGATAGVSAGSARGAIAAAAIATAIGGSSSATPSGSTSIVNIMHHHHHHANNRASGGDSGGSGGSANTNNSGSTSGIVAGGIGNGFLLNSNNSNSNSSSMNNMNNGSNGNVTTNGHNYHHSAHSHHPHHHPHHPHHPHHHHHHHHHNAAAVAAAAALNGLTVVNYESTGTSAAAAAAVASSIPTTSHHRRMKSKEMKYFGAMGLNMLLGNTQTAIENWNTMSQYSSPPLSDRSHSLRVPLTLPFSVSHAGNSGPLGPGLTTQSLFSGASTSSNRSEESPHKPMDTGEMDDNDEKLDLSERKCESTTITATITNAITTATTVATPVTLTATPPITAIVMTPSNEHNQNENQHQQLHQHPASTDFKEGLVSALANGSSRSGLNNDRLLGTVDRNSIDNNNNNGSSPIPNTNTHEAHKQPQQSQQSQQQQHRRHLFTGSTLMSNCLMARDPDHIDIKQELLVDYFHAPHPPGPPDSHRSYSSTDDNRHCADMSDEYAQDLRVSAAAAAAAAAKTLDFTHFVLPTSLRRSSDILEEKFSPLNMRKLNNGATSAASSTSAGHMLMNSLLSNESTPEDNNTPLSGRRKSISTGNGGQVTQDTASSAAAAAAAAIYAESLNKDDCDYVGSNVSVKLRTMDRTQRIIAEKLISEVLFYGQFNELERTARIQPK